jgi:hypothetical protein
LSLDSGVNPTFGALLGRHARMARLVQRTQVRELVGAAGPEWYAVIDLGRGQGEW